MKIKIRFFVLLSCLVLVSCSFDTQGIPSLSTDLCGNGIKEGDEECDELDFGGETCETLGMGQGELICTDSCEFDSSGCFSVTCGDGVIDSGEDCDGEDLGDEDCEALGFSGGVLGCDFTCRFDTSGCSSGICGDGVREGNEFCDGMDLGENTCDTLGYEGGDLACSEDCTFDVTGCIMLETCGDGEIDEGEECDDGELNSDIEPNACRENCKFPVCGDGVVDTDYNEECDDGPGNDDTTPNVCRTDCSLPMCGDEVVDTAYNEECDDGSANSDSEPNACRLDCSLPECGDGVVDTDYNEECDDGPGNSDTEPNACRTDCSLPVCGDDVVDTDYGEECDGADLGDNSCQGLGFAGGQLLCDPECAFDTSDCVELGGIGSTCESSEECNSNLCWTESGSGWPKGYCTQTCDPDTDPCSAGNECLWVYGAGYYRCFASCAQTSECRPGYSCFPTDGGPVCQPNCDANNQCYGNNCEPYSGRCGIVSSGELNGEPCVGHTGCRGYCFAEDVNTGIPPNGYCMSRCSLSKDNCPDNDVCVNFDWGADLGNCMADCANPSNCRVTQGYTCDYPPWDGDASGKVCYYSP